MFNKQRRLRSVFAIVVVAALLLGCGNSSKEAEQEQRIKELEAKIQELEQAKVEEQSEEHSAANEQEDDATDNIATLNWYTYECDSKLLDYNIKLVENPASGTKYPAIDTFCIQIDDVVFDLSKDMPMTVQGFIDKLTQSGSEGDAYSFWLNGGNEFYLDEVNEAYTPERLADGSVELLIAKNGYGYCSVHFENPESTPENVSKFITDTLVIRPAEPFNVNSESEKKVIEDSLTLKKESPYNRYFYMNSWYTGGIRRDGEMYYGGKLKYSDAPTFYEKLGLTKTEYNKGDHPEGNYYIKDSDKDKVQYAGAPLIYEYIVTRSIYTDEYYNVMAAVNYCCFFDLKSQECTGIWADIRNDQKSDWYIDDGLRFEKDQNPVIYDFSSTPGDIDYDAFMDKNTTLADLTGPYVLMSNDDADAFSEDILKEAYPDKEVKMLSRQSMDTEGYVGWILYKYSLDDKEEVIFCTNIVTGECKYGFDSNNVEETYVVFDDTYDNRGF